jgi:hypothetical protein
MKLACSALPLIILASIGDIDPSAKLDERAVLARYKKECTKEERISESCKKQKRLVEGVYYRSFRRMTAPRKKGAVERKYMVAAAKADFLALRELGLWTLAAEGTKRGPAVSKPWPEPGYLTPEEEKLYVAELNSPYPALRKVAWDGLRVSHLGRRSSRTVDERKWGVDRAYRNQFGTFWPGAPRGLSEDHPPHADRLRAMPYPKAQLQYYASGKGGAVWLTDDSLKTVETHYKGQGMESISAEVFMDLMQKFQKEKMGELAKMMESGGDPQALENEMKSLETLSKTLYPGYLFSDPKEQLHLGKEITAGDFKMIEYQVVIWRAEEIGKTGIAIEFKDLKK